jgi:hypothetical protein
MKSAKTFAAISFFLLLATCLHAACTGATSAGTFGFTTTGTPNPAYRSRTRRRRGFDYL